MVLLLNKDLLHTKKSILIALVSTFIVLSGCDKKSERRREAQKFNGGTEHVLKTDDKPCIPPQQPNSGQQTQGSVNPDSTSKAETNGVPEQGAKANANQTNANQANNGAVPCIPSSDPGPGAAKGAISSEQGGAPVATVESVGPNSPGSNNLPVSQNDGNKLADQQPAGKHINGNSVEETKLSKLDDDHSKWSDQDEEDNLDEDSTKKDKKIVKQIKTLKKILTDLSLFYKNALWAVTAKRYVTPHDFFESLLERINSTSKVFVKKNNNYIEGFEKSSCDDKALEIVVEAYGLKIYNLDCSNKETSDDYLIADIRIKNSRWFLRSTIKGLQNLLDDTKLGFITTIDIKSDDNKIPFKPACDIYINNETENDDDSSIIASATCKYWGQRVYISSDNNSPKTLIFDEFKYDYKSESELEVKARAIDFTSANQQCTNYQVEAVANKRNNLIFNTTDDTSDCDEELKIEGKQEEDKNNANQKPVSESSEKVVKVEDAGAPLVIDGKELNKMAQQPPNVTTLIDENGNEQTVVSPVGLSSEESQQIDFSSEAPSAPNSSELVTPN